MHIRDEYEFRKSYVAEHNPGMRPADIAQAIMKDRDFYERWRHYQAYRVDPGPSQVTKTAAPTYDATLAQVTALAKAKGVPRDEAFVQLLKAQDGTPAFATTYAHYKTFHLTDGLADRDAAALAKDERPIFSTAAARADPDGIVTYVERLVRQLALTMAMSDDEMMQRLRAKYPGLHAEYVRAKTSGASLPANAPTSVDSLKMARR